MKKVNKEKDFKELLEVLKVLHEDFPDESMCKHLGLATEDYKHIEDVPSEKELVFLLNKYHSERVIDFQIPYTDFDEEVDDGDF